MIKFKHKGSLNSTKAFLRRNKKIDFSVLEKFGDEGIAALKAATPVDTGETATSWSYRIVEERENVRIEWYNTHVVDGVPIAIIIQYGHATGTGGYVEGLDYINPAIKPIFERIVDNIWREVKR